MSNKDGAPVGENIAGANSTAPAKKPLPAQNPALRMMGLPRFRLPSRNWMIFLSITGSFTGAVVYDKWQTKRTREKWCRLVSHVAEEALDAKTAPRKVTIYLAAPPGDGLRSAREHFHKYVKPVLVSAAMDWDVIEGRKEGDVRHKTAEKIRKQRKQNGEGDPVVKDEADGELTLESIRRRNGDVDYPGVAGDIVIGRHAWKEYIRGLHEGLLGPADPPKQLESESPSSIASASHVPDQSPAAIKEASETVSQNSTDPPDAIASTAPTTSVEMPSDTQATEKKEEEKPKRRFPAPYILPQDYDSAMLSSSTPEIIGPSAGVRMPHLLGIRNTHIRLYRFLTRRTIQDDVGRQVAAAVLASYRPYSTTTVLDKNSASDKTVDGPEQQEVLSFEEKDWWKKTVNRPREEHEESVWIEPMVFDERIASRMRAFQLTSEDEDRAKRTDSATEH